MTREDVLGELNQRICIQSMAKHNEIQNRITTLTGKQTERNNIITL